MYRSFFWSVTSAFLVAVLAAGCERPPEPKYTWPTWQVPPDTKLQFGVGGSGPPPQKKDADEQPKEKEPGADAKPDKVKKTDADQ